MQYSHLTQGLADRRDSTLDSNGSVSVAKLRFEFETHQIPTQGLNPHHLSTNSYGARPQPDYRLSPGPTPSPIHGQQNGTTAHQQSSSTSHYAYNSNQQPPPSTSSPAMKRKPDTPLSQAQNKRRREPIEEIDSFDMETGGQGAKHWTDEEKTKLFTWLMGVGQDEHWQSLRSAKNSCLRECATEVFGGKKTYQALKGCFERNFNLFKQIYAFENYHASAQSVLSSADADRLKEYERRLAVARRAGCDVGNVTARTIDHWHRAGWYSLFHHRWHGDPQTVKPTPSIGRNGNLNVDEIDGEDDNEVSMEFDNLNSSPRPPPGHPISSPSTNPNTNTMPHVHDRQQALPSYVNPQSLSHSPTVPNHSGTSHSQHSHVPHVNTPSAASSSTLLSSSTSGLAASQSGHQPRNSLPIQTPIPTISTPQISPSVSTSAPTSDNTAVNVTLTQGMINAYLQFLQVQTQTNKMKLEYMRRREEREEAESTRRREMEHLKLERENQKFEHEKLTAHSKQRTDRAIEVLSNPNVDSSVKKAAGEYLKRLFDS
ncbi:Histone acetyltransferase [Marasmius sp. AFHP31]|nr:Histone acetyltransferase [Marasmius sp. AFHP31]